MSLPKIDLHSHFVPGFYRDALREAGHGHPDGMPAIPQWSEEAHLDFHTKLNVTKSILSITSPGTHLKPGDDQEARGLTRRVNKYASDLKKKRPDQFGFFASLPLPDVEGSLAEIAYADDELNADGFTLMTNHHGYYPGDPRFDPIFDELNKRKAIVFIHPTTPCSVGHHPNACRHAAPLEKTYPRPMFEFLFDTARAYINLFLSGTISRCPDITFVVCHAGGVLPPLITRFASAPQLLKLPGMDLNVTPSYVKERLNSDQFFFDTAGWVFPDQIKGLLAYLDAKGERMVYGSDFPWTPFAGVEALSKDHDKYLSAFFPGEEDKVMSRNAKKLLEWKGKQK